MVNLFLMFVGGFCFGCALHHIVQGDRGTAIVLLLFTILDLALALT